MVNVTEFQMSNISFNTLPNMLHVYYILLWCVSPRFLGDTHYVIICGVSP